MQDAVGKEKETQPERNVQCVQKGMTEKERRGSKQALVAVERKKILKL